MADIIEFHAMPTHCSRPSGESGKRDRGKGPHDRESFDCEHLRLVFKGDTVECRACGRLWQNWKG